MTFFEMTGTVVRSLLKKPATLMYPYAAKKGDLTGSCRD